MKIEDGVDAAYTCDDCAQVAMATSASRDAECAGACSVTSAGAVARRRAAWFGRYRRVATPLCGMAACGCASVARGRRM